MCASFWESSVSKNTLLSIIAKHQGVILDDELYTILKKDYPDLSYKELNRMLMELEIQGLIYVSQITKSKRRVELVKEGQEFLGVGED
ncbi:MAG: hypothetical protein OdinLCB4_004145 [Candidatus Odinarchaeum yellowstonii]|jgi:Fe2+ or Zn2+ uptake regulation protein|uniref:Uncharacterized protein n=1 Tax=Odinarchaeota yellowstonii (strain LCB_4) TaxID=1841599 RepID=A0AAF0IAE1_ODILC|nr:MAG: hypothetical protein OdinLCB4_004145 [Candidatus Odinarchaeum yellowstonii]